MLFLVTCIELQFFDQDPPSSFFDALRGMETILKTFILDCAARKKAGLSTSGIYTIDPDGKGVMNVLCDMATNGGGWTVIQRRIDSSTDFYLGWASYKQGFGSLTGNFWLGNDNIHRLTASGNSVLRVDLEDWDGNTGYAVYGKFVVDDESNNYKLSLADYDQSSSAGNSFRSSNNRFFITKDRDAYSENENPAVYFKGAWWYKSVSSLSNLNGQYLGNEIAMQGMIWSYFTGPPRSLKRAEMKIRPSSFI